MFPNKERYIAGLADFAKNLVPKSIKDSVQAETCFVEAGGVLGQVAQLAGKPVEGHVSYQAEAEVAINLATLPPVIANFLSDGLTTEPSPVRVHVQQAVVGGGFPDKRAIEVSRGKKTVRAEITSYALFSGEEILPSHKQRGVAFSFRDGSGVNIALLPIKGQNLGVARGMISALQSELNRLAS